MSLSKLPEMSELKSPKIPIVKKILIVKDVNAVQVKVLKRKFIDQINRWQADNSIDKDWCEVIGYYNDIQTFKPWKMVVFKYKGHLYHIEHITFFHCMGYDINMITKIENEFVKFPQLFVE